MKKNKKDCYIRSSKHHFKNYINYNKQLTINQFIKDYNLLLQKYINIVWNDFKYDDIPSRLDSNICNKINSPLSHDSRLRQCAASQACSIINSIFSKHNKRIYILKKLQKQGKLCKNLQKKVDSFKPTKPIAKDINPILDNRFFDIKETKSGHFNLFIKIKQIGNKKQILIPINHHKVSNKYLKLGEVNHSIELNQNYVKFSFSIKKHFTNLTGNILGSDQGFNKCLTLSDGQTTNKDKNNHDLKSICSKLNNKIPGSKGFEKTQAHRKNYINWSINQLNFDNVKELRFEKIKNIRKDKSVKGKMKHWTYTDIRTKVLSLSESKGFRFIEQDNKFRSQRCNQCGWVHKSNRNGELFKCCSAICGYTADADLNGALNHSIDLYEIPQNHVVWSKRMNWTSGFYWCKSGLYNTDGKQI